MAFSFEPLLAISAGHIMAVSAGPEQNRGSGKGHLVDNEDRLSKRERLVPLP